jgi:hypothetical protein
LSSPSSLKAGDRGGYGWFLRLPNPRLKSKRATFLLSFSINWPKTTSSLARWFRRKADVELSELQKHRPDDEEFGATNISADWSMKKRSV